LFSYENSNQSAVDGCASGAQSPLHGGVTATINSASLNIS
jgi:hypothetical protein